MELPRTCAPSEVLTSAPSEVPVEEVPVEKAPCTWRSSDAPELQCVVVWCSVLQYVVIEILAVVLFSSPISSVCGVLHCVSKHLLHGVVQCGAVCCGVLQCVAVCCSVLQCAALCCSVLQPTC